MASADRSDDLGYIQGEKSELTASAARPEAKVHGWKRIISRRKAAPTLASSGTTSSTEDDLGMKAKPEKWSMGVLNDRETEEVPAAILERAHNDYCFFFRVAMGLFVAILGSIILMSKANRNEPLGLRNAPARTSASSLPSPYPPDGSRPSSQRPPLGRRRTSERSVEEKKTADGKIILHPQPDDSMNDPLNWPAWRRDVALLSLGFYCMLGGGMTPVLAAGFNNVAAQYNVSIPRVALTTGLYMMGLGLGSVVASPTAILFGKRPVYLAGTLLFVVSAIWCALSPNYASLVVARVVMGFAVSPIECLPSATIAEIYYLHERAYRLGVYTLLLLSGKNLIPLVSAAIIEGLSWQWVFWIVAMVVGFCFVLNFLFLPETFWDRTPRPHAKTRRPGLTSLSRIFTHHQHDEKNIDLTGSDSTKDLSNLAHDHSVSGLGHATIAERRRQKHKQHVGFADQAQDPSASRMENGLDQDIGALKISKATQTTSASDLQNTDKVSEAEISRSRFPRPSGSATNDGVAVEGLTGEEPQTRDLHSSNSPSYLNKETLDNEHPKDEHEDSKGIIETHDSGDLSSDVLAPGGQCYTHHLRTQPPKTYIQTLRPWNGRLRSDNWLLVAFRPFILFAYPSILWSTLVYSLSIGWLIILSETVSSVYQNKKSYNFTPLQTGLVYISPFLGGVLGTAVAGKVSDIIVRFMSRRNGGVYEPEFRLVMAIPVTISTCIGLMGFGWSAEERDNWIVPTVFFGIISFGCALGSTTSITFAVDSYRQYAGEALVTLNFSKNIFHGLVFSLFFNKWLEADGTKNTFLAIGGIQLACLMTTIPVYIYGKRFRMWTVRKNFMEKF